MHINDAGWRNIQNGPRNYLPVSDDDHDFRRQFADVLGNFGALYTLRLENRQV